jgi:hypothetical protein
MRWFAFASMVGLWTVADHFNEFVPAWLQTVLVVGLLVTVLTGVVVGVNKLFKLVF